MDCRENFSPQKDKPTYITTHRSSKSVLKIYNDKEKFLDLFFISGWPKMKHSVNPELQQILSQPSFNPNPNLN